MEKEQKQNEIRDLIEEESLAQTKLKAELEELAKKPSLTETEKRALKLKEDAAKFKTLLGKTKEHIESIVKKGRQYSEVENHYFLCLSEEKHKIELNHRNLFKIGKLKSVMEMLKNQLKIY